jgi:hypothetical protein
MRRGSLIFGEDLSSALAATAAQKLADMDARRDTALELQL